MADSSFRASEGRVVRVDGMTLGRELRRRSPQVDRRGLRGSVKKKRTDNFWIGAVEPAADCSRPAVRRATPVSCANARGMRTARQRNENENRVSTTTLWNRPAAGIQ